MLSFCLFSDIIIYLYLGCYFSDLRLRCNCSYLGYHFYNFVYHSEMYNYNIESSSSKPENGHETQQPLTHDYTALRPRTRRRHARFI